MKTGKDMALAFIEPLFHVIYWLDILFLFATRRKGWEDANLATNLKIIFHVYHGSHNTVKLIKYNYWGFLYYILTLKFKKKGERSVAIRSKPTIHQIPRNNELACVGDRCHRFQNTKTPHNTTDVSTSMVLWAYLEKEVGWGLEPQSRNMKHLQIL